MTKSDLVSVVASLDDCLSKLDASESLDIARLYLSIFEFRDYLNKFVSDYVC